MLGMIALTHAQKKGLEAAFEAYLTAEGGRFARTLAAFMAEAQLPGSRSGGSGDEDDVDDATQTGALIDAVKTGDLATVQLYVCVGVDVRTLLDEEIGASPLYWAARCNHVELVRYFVQCGLDKDAGNVGKAVGSHQGETPMYIAAWKGHVEVVRYLAEQGADKDKAMNDGRTPLFIAADCGHMAVVQCLAEQGADKDRAMNDGATPLIFGTRLTFLCYSVAHQGMRKHAGIQHIVCQRFFCNPWDVSVKLEAPTI